MKSITTKKVGSALAALEGVAGDSGTVGASGAAAGGPVGLTDKPTNRSSMHTPRQQYRVMDEVARRRRLKHELEQLERDNYHEDPHANLTLSKKVPKFEDGLKGSDKNLEGRRRSNLRLRSLNFMQLVEEDSKRPAPNYSTAVAPSPEQYNLPRRHFCCVCGVNGKYTCVTCGARFCSINCRGVHQETRCMKWIA